jgi:glycine/D-amino acid oxidase-like deaminating enzyme
MMSSLIDLALELGIRIYTGCEVKHIEFDTNPVRIGTVTNKQTVEFRAAQIALCTNAFTSSLLPDIDLEPGRGQVLITKPIHNLDLKGSFHYHRGYHYFRPIDNRILIGGGRQLDKPGETSLAFAPNETILNQLKEDLQRFILPGLEVSIESNWTGIMAFGKSKNPIVKKASENVFVASRLGGMGIAIGAGVADDLITLLESQ